MQQDIILIIVLIFIAIITCAMLWHRLRRYSRDWQEQTKRQWTHIQTSMEAIRENLETVTQTANHHPPQTPGPYKATAQTLHQRLPPAQATYESIKVQFEDLQAKSYHPPLLPVSWLPLGIWRQCRYWRHRYEAIYALQDAIQSTQHQVNYLLELHKSLQEMPLKVARQVKALQQAIGESFETGRELKTQGVHGKPLETALTQVQALKSELLTLPNYFLQGTDAVVMKKASQTDVVTSWRTVETLTHPIETQADKFQRWRSKYQYICRSLDKLQEHIRNAEESLTEASQHINVDDIATALTHVQSDAQTVQVTFPALNIADFEQFSQEVRSLIAQAKEVWQCSEDLRETFARLQRTLHQNTTMLEQLRTEMDAMANAKVCPIVWKAYQDELTHLHRLDANTREITDTWTPAKLAGHMSIADKLNQKVLTLFHEIMRLRTEREALVQYLRYPEFAPKPQWLRQAEALSRQIHPYASMNWPKQLAVSKILEDARYLAQQRQQFVPAHINDAVAAQELSARVEATRQLLHSLEIFENRLQHIANTLAFIQQAERNARETLRTIQEHLAPLSRQLKSLKSSPIDRSYPRSPIPKSKRSLKKLQRDGRRLASKLNRQNRGHIRDKARAVEAWAAACHKVLQDLPSAIQTEIAYIETKLGDEIQGLKKWAPFDNEHVLNTAQRHLARRRPGPASSPPVENPLAVLSAQVTNLLQEREDLVNILSNLQSQVRAPLEKSFATLEKLGPEAHKEVNTLKALKNRAQATWPALTCDSQTAENLLDAARKHEERLHRSGRTVTDVHQQLNAAIQQYRTAISEAQTQQKHLRQARNDLQNELNRLARWQGQLKAYQQSHSEDADIREAVHMRLNEIERAMRRARRRHNTPLPLSEASRMLQELWTLAHQDLRSPGSGHVIKVREIERGS